MEKHEWKEDKPPSRPLPKRRKKMKRNATSRLLWVRQYGVIIPQATLPVLVCESIVTTLISVLPNLTFLYLFVCLVIIVEYAPRAYGGFSSTRCCQ